MKKIIAQILNFIFYFFKVNEKKILFESGRNLIDENPKALYCYIKKNNPNNFKTIWLVTKKTDTTILEKEDFAYYNTLKGLYHLATSKYWIGSQSIGNILKKKKNQIYIQTWHGYGPSKRMGYDINNCTNRPPMAHTKEWDYFIASSPLDEQIITSSTGYDKETVILGSATTDQILEISRDINKINKIKKDLGIQEKDFNKKIIFYAPSFRDSDLIEKQTHLKIDSFHEIKDSIFLVRLHPLIAENINPLVFSDNIINACSYPDSSEILGLTDILISDYSSIISKFAILNRPIILYAHDLDSYLTERGFYLDYKKDMPAPIVYTEEELFKTILNIENIQKKYEKKLTEFNKKYNYLNDGHVCERILQKINNGYFLKHPYLSDTKINIKGENLWLFLRKFIMCGLVGKINLKK